MSLYVHLYGICNFICTLYLNSTTCLTSSAPCSAVWRQLSLYCIRFSSVLYLYVHLYSICNFICMVHQASTTCGASSQPDLIQNYFLIARMLRFLRHSRQKVPYLNISRQKVTYFNVFFWQKLNFSIFCNKQREIQRWNSFSLSHSVSRSISSLSLHFLIFSPFPLNFFILFPFPHSLSIFSFSFHFLILCHFRSLSLSFSV